MKLTQLKESFMALLELVGLRNDTSTRNDAAHTSCDCGESFCERDT